MNLAGIRIEGVAVSGIASAITLPELGVCLDLGIATSEALRCQTVLITHGHLDHFYGIVRHAYIRHMTGGLKSRFICEPRLKPLIRELFRVISKFQMGRNPDYEIITIEPGQEVQLKRGLFVRAFKTHHRIPSQGYLLVEKRDKLKDEYKVLEGREIGRLRKSGVEVTYTVEYPLLAYTGDTEASVFDVAGETMDLVRRAQVLVTECTFLGEEQSEAFARKRGHTHMAELAARADIFNNEAVLFVHFSQRYYNRLIVREIGKLPEPLRSKAYYLPLEESEMPGSPFKE
jgi:ribonuclease Z